MQKLCFVILFMSSSILSMRPYNPEQISRKCSPKLSTSYVYKPKMKYRKVSKSKRFSCYDFFIKQVSEDCPGLACVLKDLEDVVGTRALINFILNNIEQEDKKED